MILRVHATSEFDWQKSHVEWRLPLKVVTKQAWLSQRTRKTNHYVIWDKNILFTESPSRLLWNARPPAVIANGNSAVSYLHLPFWFGEPLSWMKSCAPNVDLPERFEITCARVLETSYYRRAVYASTDSFFQLSFICFHFRWCCQSDVVIFVRKRIQRISGNCYGSLILQEIHCDLESARHSFHRQRPSMLILVQATRRQHVDRIVYTSGEA